MVISYHILMFGNESASAIPKVSLIYFSTLLKRSVLTDGESAYSSTFILRCIEVTKVRDCSLRFMLSLRYDMSRMIVVLYGM